MYNTTCTYQPCTGTHYHKKNYLNTFVLQKCKVEILPQ